MSNGWWWKVPKIKRVQHLELKSNNKRNWENKAEASSWRGSEFVFSSLNFGIFPGQLHCISHPLISIFLAKLMVDEKTRVELGKRGERFFVAKKRVWLFQSQFCTYFSRATTVYFSPSDFNISGKTDGGWKDEFGWNWAKEAEASLWPGSECGWPGFSSLLLLVVPSILGIHPSSLFSSKVWEYISTLLLIYFWM